MGKSPMNVVVLLGVGEGQAGMAGTDRAPVLLLPDGLFVTDGESSAVARHAISALPVSAGDSSGLPWLIQPVVAWSWACLVCSLFPW